MLRQRGTAISAVQQPPNDNNNDDKTINNNIKEQQPKAPPSSSCHSNGDKARSNINGRRIIKRTLVAIVFIVYVVLPLFYRHCTWVRRNIIYLNAFNSVPVENMTNPVRTLNDVGGDVTLDKCARNFYFSPEEGISLGAWHVVPDISKSVMCSSNGSILDVGVAEFDDHRPVIFHLHGSAGCRASDNRVALIRILTSEPINAHVLTFDYRGFGDSTPARPTVETVSRDVAALYKWLRLEKKVDNKRIFYYGQSLGTGVAIHLAHAVQEQLGGPSGIILEAPYTDIAEASFEHPYTYLHTYYPWKRDCFVTPIRHPDTFWDSQSRIGNVSAPVLILHAEDDDIIPYKLGEKLYRVGLATRDPRRQPTRMVSYPASKGYGHNAVCSDPDIRNVYSRFIREFGQFD